MQHQPITRKLHGLDHLRAFAIIYVFLFHYGIFKHPDWIPTIGSFGWTGVDLFFVLSGFLIAGQLFAEKDISLRTFYTKRVFRIFPAFFVIVALYFLFPPLREREALPPLWKFLTFTQNLGLNLQTNGTFSHAWSLCIEEQFYLILPLMIIFIPRKAGVWIMGILFLAGLALRLYCWYQIFLPDDSWVTWYKYIYYPTYARLDGLLVGVGVAAIQHRLTKYRIHLLIAGLVILAGCYIMCLDEDLFNRSIIGFPLISLGYGCIVSAAASPEVKAWKISSSIAALSYALYLSHKMVIHVTQEWFSKWGVPENSTYMFVICTLTCLIAAWMLRMIVEKTCLRWRDKVLARL